MADSSSARQIAKLERELAAVKAEYVLQCQATENQKAENERLRRQQDAKDDTAVNVQLSECKQVEPGSQPQAQKRKLIPEKHASATKRAKLDGSVKVEGGEVALLSLPGQQQDAVASTSREQTDEPLFGAEGRWSNRYKRTAAKNNHDMGYERKMLSLIYLHLLHMEYHNKFQLASNMEAAGKFSILIATLWNTFLVKVVYNILDKKYFILIPDLLALSGDFSLIEYCHSYETLKESEEFHSLPYINRHEIIVLTNSDLANGLAHVVEFRAYLDTGGKAVSFKARGEIFKGLCEWVDIKEALTKLHGQVEGKSAKEVERKVKDAIQNMKFEKNLWVSAFKGELLGTPTSVKLNDLLKKLEPVKEKDTYSSFLDKFRLYTNQVHDLELNAKIKKQLAIVCKSSADREVRVMLRALQANVKLWWEKDNFYLNRDSPLWLAVVKTQTECLSNSTIERLTEADIEFEKSSLQILDDRINKMSSVGGILNLRVDSRTAASSLRVHQALAKFRPNKIVLHVNLKALLEREDDMLSAWATHWCHLLVVECHYELDQSQAERIAGKIMKIAVRGGKHKVLVLIAPEDHELNLRLYDAEGYTRFNDNFVWSDLTENSMDNILSTRVKINSTQSPLCLSGLLRVDKLLLNKFDLEGISQFLERDVSCGKDLNKEVQFFVARRLKTSADSIPFVVHSSRDVGEKVVLVVAEPGMGKSTLMRYLASSAKQEDPSAWIVHIELSKCAHHLKEVNVDQFNEYEAKKFLERVACKTATSFEKLLLGVSMNKLAVFVDGVDEVCPHYERQVFKLLEFFKDKEFSQLWVASRPLLQAKLETTLQVRSRHLVSFSTKDRIEFFNKLWMVNIPTASSEKCSEVTESLLTFLNDSFGKDNPILSIPLTAVMIAEILQKQLFSTNNQIDAFKGHEQFKFMNLYSMFIKIKFELYCSENRDLPAQIHENETLLEQIYHQHRLAALRILFSREEIAGLRFEGKDKFDQDLATYLKEVSDGRDELGIIDNVVDGNLHYVHRSFAEYFAASWLALNFKANKRFVERIIFDPAYKLVSEMFHRSLAGNHLLHVAVLNRDLEATKSFLSNKSKITDVYEIDEGGRTPLHLAALLSGTDRHPDDVAIVEYLALKQNAGLEVPDAVLGWSPLRYAEWARAWKAFQILIEKVGICSGSNRKEEDWPRVDPAAMLDAARDASVFVVRYLVEERGGELDCRGTEGENMIHRAAEGGNIATVKYLVSMGLSPHTKDNEENTSLHYATYRDHVPAVSFLLDEGLDKEACNSDGLTVLQEAARQGAYQVMAFLLELSTSFNVNSAARSSNVQRNASLLCAAFAGRLESVKELIRIGASVDHQDNKGHTAAWVAVHRGHNQVLDWLMLQGIFASNVPLHGACVRGELDVVSYILSRGDDIDAKAGGGKTALMIAAGCNKVAVMEFLLEKGANVEGCDESGNTSLHEASERGFKQAVELLLRHGAQIDPTNGEGETPLHKAISEGKLGVAMRLMDEDYHWPGNKYTQVGHLGLTQLVAMAIKGKLDRIKFILATFNPRREAMTAGNYINLQDTAGWNVLHYMARLGNSEIIGYLIGQGGDPKIGDQPIGVQHFLSRHHNMTPLHLATSLNHTATMRVLLACHVEAHKGPAVDKRDSNGNSALIWGAKVGSLEGVGILIEAGGKLTQVNDIGWTALMVATFWGHVLVVKLLLKSFDKNREGMLLKDFIYMKNEKGKTALNLAGKKCKKVLKNCLAKI